MLKVGLDLLYVSLTDYPYAPYGDDAARSSHGNDIRLLALRPRGGFGPRPIARILVRCETPAAGDFVGANRRRHIRRDRRLRRCRWP